MKKILPVLAFLLVACGPSQGQIETAIAQTQAAAPTATSVPTETPKPTATLVPTETATLAPTKTRKPTDTATTEPTATPLPEPVVYEGTGDSIVDIKNPFGLAIIHIVGNSGSQYFGVKTYDASNNELDLLVNTGDPYDGVRPLDWEDGKKAARLEIKSGGKWHVDISPLASLEKNQPPTTVTGKGDNVVLFCCDAKVDTLKIKGNANKGYFGVVAWGTDTELLVNTGDPYDGTVLLPGDLAVGSGIFTLVIRAEGDWSVEATVR